MMHFIHDRLFTSYQVNADLLYSITIYMLHYNPEHVSSSTLLIFRRTNCIITASGIVTQMAVQYAGWERTAVRSQPAYCDDTRGCINTFFPPEDEHSTARNMSRII